MTLEETVLATAPEASLDQSDTAEPSVASPTPAGAPRARLSLDGEWQFAFCGDGLVPLAEVADWRTCVVPAPWQAQFADLRERNGRAWYRRTFELPAGWIPSAAALVLRFGAVNYHARVWVNGRLAVEHEGGYLPFEAEIGALVRPGRNEVAVAVTAPTDDRELYPDFPVGEVPFGKQSWYGPLGGIWQSVHLERRAADHVRAVRLTPCLRTGRVDVARGAVTSPDAGRASSSSRSRTPTAPSWPRPRSSRPRAMTAPPPRSSFWARCPGRRRPRGSTASPPPCAAAASVLDALSETFGFRTVEARDGRIYLNGEPVYLRGALDQDYYPDGICTTPSEAFLEDQFRKAKALGLNCVRCHIKVPDPRYYAVADRVGLLVWTELPNVGRLTDRRPSGSAPRMEGILERDGNHPSIVCWTIINENWGTDLVHDAEHRAWLNRTYRWLKALDPTRLVVDNSPCPPNFHVESDLDDFHFYAALPDHRRRLGRLRRRASPTAVPRSFSPHGDAKRTGREPRHLLRVRQLGPARPGGR